MKRTKNAWMNPSKGVFSGLASTTHMQQQTSKGRTEWKEQCNLGTESEAWAKEKPPVVVDQFNGEEGGGMD